MNHSIWQTIAYLVVFGVLYWNLMDLKDKKRTLRQHLHTLGLFLFVISIYLVNILYVLSDILKKMH